MSQLNGPGILVHAGALVVREYGLLIRGASGSGKSMLAGALVREAERRGWFGRIVADDTVEITASHGRLVARPHPLTAGFAERRGFGIENIPHEPACVLHVALDLEEHGAIQRLPAPADMTATVVGIPLRRFALPAGAPVYDNVYRALESIGAFGSTDRG